MLAQLPPNANNCNVLATIKHSTQIPDIRTHTQACAKKTKKTTHLRQVNYDTHGEFPNAGIALTQNNQQCPVIFQLFIM